MSWGTVVIPGTLWSLLPSLVACLWCESFLLYWKAPFLRSSRVFRSPGFHPSSLGVLALSSLHVFLLPTLRLPEDIALVSLLTPRFVPRIALSCRPLQWLFLCWQLTDLFPQHYSVHSTTAPAAPSPLCLSPPSPKNCLFPVWPSVFSSLVCHRGSGNSPTTCPRRWLAHKNVSSLSPSSHSETWTALGAATMLKVTRLRGPTRPGEIHPLGEPAFVPASLSWLLCPPSRTLTNPAFQLNFMPFWKKGLYLIIPAMSNPPNSFNIVTNGSDYL